MITKDEARREVERELERRNPTKAFTPAEVLMFCQEMYNKLDFRSKTDRLGDIRAWAERWLNRRFPNTYF